MHGIDTGSDLSDLLKRLGVVLFRRAADSTLRFTDVEGRCAERMGLSRATLTGDAYSFWSRVEAEDRRRVLRVLEEGIRKGCEYRVAYRLTAQDGTMHRVREEGAPILGPDGAVVALQGVLLDGTDELADVQRQRVLADLEESKERFRALAANSGEMIAEISPRRRISFASRCLCEELGRSESDLLGTDPISLVHPQDQEHVLATVREAVRADGPAEVLCRLARADGSWLWAELAGRPFQNAGGEQQGVITGRNVENRIRVEETFLAQHFAEARIGKLSRRFVELGSEQLDGAIQEGVEAAAAIAGADRCYLLAFQSRQIQDAQTYVWQRDELDPWTPRVSSADEERNLWIRDRLMGGEIVRIPRVRDLPDELAGARDHLTARGIRSYCVIPVRSGGRVTALLGLQSIRCECEWTEQQLALLRLVAELFASALHRREVEGELRDSEQRLRALTDGAQDAICENELVSGEILYANPRFYDMHGYASEEAEGMSSFDFMHPEDLEMIQNVHRAYERGDLGDVNSGTLLYRGRHKDGSYRWLEANGRMFRNAKGEGRSAAVIRDVTVREAAQKAMERRLEDQRRIANLARDLLALGVDEIDAGVADGLVSLLPISQADRTWLVAGDPILGRDKIWEWSAGGLPAPAISMEQSSLATHPYARQCFESGRELVLPDASLRHDSAEMSFLGSRGAASILAIPLLSGRDVIGVIGFERMGQDCDWSEEAVALLRLGGEVLVSAISRKGAEALLRESRGQLLQAQKMEAVGTLAGGVAHDFNNQLSVILGNARFVRGAVLEDEDLREAMVDLERAGEHCAQLTRSLLSFSRHAPAERKATSVAKVLRDVGELTGPMVERWVHFETSAHDESDAVLADRTQLQQVLVNLVVNASDAMPDGGNLSITTERRTLDAAEAERLGVPAAGEYVQFAVADTGFGMDEDTLQRIFEPFFTTKAPGKGTGLGLATVYGILQESKGAIWAESEPGIGTTFRLLLPLAEGDDEEEPRCAGEGLEGGETLLLVEDDESIRRLLRRMLGRMGFHVLEARGGVEALKTAEEYPGDIDVLVSDVSMSEMGGVELGRRLLRQRPTVRVLLVTGHPEDDVSLPGARLLCKPFRQEELSWALQALLSGKPDRP